MKAQDDLPDNVVRVFVLYKPDASSNWRDLELVHTPGTTRWTSSAVVSGGLSYFVYAVDGAGNVATSSNKGALYQVATFGAPSGLSISVSGPQATGGWYTNAQITVAGASGATFETSVDGAPFQPYTAPFSLTGDGIHFVQARGSDASTGEISVPVDANAPRDHAGVAGRWRDVQAQPGRERSILLHGRRIGRAELRGVDSPMAAASTRRRLGTLVHGQCARTSPDSRARITHNYTRLDLRIR